MLSKKQQHMKYREMMKKMMQKREKKREMMVDMVWDEIYIFKRERERVYQKEEEEVSLL